MKRILPLILAAAMTLTAGTAALADNVSDALEKAATMTNDELYAKAQEEMAAGAQLNFYSTTSFAEKAAANFMRAYPALDGKVVYAEIDDGESYTILTNTIGSGVKDSADMALTQNGADLKTYLLDDGLSYAYFPKALESVVDEQYREPAVVTFVNSLLIYNNTAGSVGLTNVWELTEAKWKDKVFFKDPTNETVNINFLIMLTSPEWNEKLEKAYESYYGKAWEKGEFESAAYEWIAGFLSNVNYTYTSASKMATGIASGADVIVIPEIPYDARAIAAAIQQRAREGKRFSIVAVAEGAISREEAAMSKKDFRAARAAMPYPSISYRLADELQKITSQEIRVTIPGHFQRGGAPCAADRLLCTRLGVAAAELIREGKFGNMVAVQNDRIVPVPLKEVAGRLKTVPVDGELVRAARELGLCMGD